ncbi:hypothetical protein [Streptosporangium carneum]|uniref:Uncharacterized protein n=1 Tax=Streptosporangium carneum TaxID=47481 RepID=A0A9W6MGZ6_9ACTN|nr:hypothetical protein [Streptosporangium carneum]GLK13766.1 hypothetical protein GCM10017600_71770 [Streptosporangium carneum]
MGRSSVGMPEGGASVGVLVGAPGAVVEAAGLGEVADEPPPVEHADRTATNAAPTTATGTARATEPALDVGVRPVAKLDVEPGTAFWRNDGTRVTFIHLLTGGNHSTGRGVAVNHHKILAADAYWSA